MTDTGIECFLAVCRYKTGRRAAEALYITQSSLTTRLKNLERELGGQLFYRKKGGREMTLTEAGKAFYALAQQYEKLMEQMPPQRGSAMYLSTCASSLLSQSKSVRGLENALL